MPPLARSRNRVGRGYLGPVPDEMWDMLAFIHDQGLAVSANAARERARLVALAASIGWLSTIDLDGQGHGGIWHITAEGLAAYKEHKG